MARIIRRVVGNKKRGAALIAALQIISLMLIGFLTFIGGPQRSPKAPAETQVSGPAQQVASAAADALQQPAQTADQTETAQPITAADLTAAEKAALRRSAHAAKKLYEPLASQVFNLQRSRVEAQAAQRSAQGPEALDNGPTLTTDREDYPPYSYVYFHGAGFEPGEPVDMIVAETDPVQQSFEPWTVVADANGEFDTSWYVFSQDFNGATFLATATGETSQLTASATFTDANGAGNMQVNPAFAVSGSSGNSFRFDFRTPNATFAASSIVTIVVPAGWPAPTFPGNVSAAVADGTASVTSTAASGSTITITFTLATAGDTNGFHLTYSPAGTAPSAGFYEFTTSSRNGTGG